MSRWIGIQTDVTQRRQTENALQAVKQAAEMNSRAKSEFLANMSHEIRTPLNAVVGMTELVLDTELSPDQKDYLDCVHSSANTLLALLNDVLDLSKIEARKMEIETVDFDLAELVTDTLQTMAIRAHEKGLELAVELPMEFPLMVQGDPTRLRQVLLNLVGNAIKFTKTGEVSVSVESQWMADNEISFHFAVRDTGIGIPDDRLREIFESFRQVEASTNRRFGGTGLGLTITAELIELMHGEIWVQSEVDKGSTFHFNIQFKRAKSDASKSSEIQAADLRGKQALVVVPQSTTRRIICKMLRHWGVETVLVDCRMIDTSEIERLIPPEQEVDLLLIDGAIAEPSILRLVESVQGRCERPCKTILLKSSVDRTFVFGSLSKAGIQCAVTKPVAAPSMLNAIRAVDSGEQPSCNLEHRDLGQVNQTSGPAVIHESPHRRLDVLVVDDHEPNRKLAAAILQRRGHKCQLATDGNEAVSACRDSDFDVVLMDVQMPGIDGFEATQRIRKHERPGGKQVPIIALTAHALVGDSDKCLAAGMNAYLPKPIHARDLVEMVESLALRERSIRQPSTTHHQNDQRMPFDISAALDRMNGELDLLLQHIGYVIHDAPELIDAMRRAARQADARSLEIASHRMKSLVGAYSYTQAVELAYELEVMGKENNLANASSVIRRLAERVETFIESIDQYARTHR
ncbi:MAG: response regulator [Pirellulaceae bacterium]|nr:response regulator [Pirellulaceae bacterium]